MVDLVSWAMIAGLSLVLGLLGLREFWLGKGGR